MPEQRITTLKAPIRPEILEDPYETGVFIANLMRGAREGLDTICEGRAYTIEKVKLVIADGGPSFIRDLFDAEIQVTAELTE